MTSRYRFFVQYVVGIVVLVHAVFTYTVSRDIKDAAQSGLALASQVFSASVIVAMVGLWLWEHWIWKCPLVQRIPVVTRCVSGTWKGTFKSSWTDPATGKEIDTRDAYLCVRQTFSSTYATFFTEESKSKSFTAAISREPDGAWCMVEIYRNEPRIALQERSRSHWGAMKLDLLGTPANGMEGYYWNDRKSIGELSFAVRRRSRVDSYQDAAKLFAKAS